MGKLMLRWAFYCMLSTIGGLFLPLQIHAQDNTHPFFVTTTPNVYSLSPFWSEDSRFFVFGGEVAWAGAVQTNDLDSWLQYEVATGELRTSSRWQLQPELTAQQMALFEIGAFVDEDYGRQISRVFISPNGRYIVYGSYHHDVWYELQTTLGIADLLNDTYTVIEIPISPFSTIYCDAGFFCVKWADDSSAFLLAQFIPVSVTQFFYFTGFSDNLTDVEVIDFSETAFILEEDQSVRLAAPEANEANTYTYGFWDMADRNHVLLNLGKQIVIWNPSNEAQSRRLDVGEREIFNAAFYPNTTDKVLYISKRGLMMYDILDEQTTMLDANISSRDTFFSPNGRFLVNVVYDVDTDQSSFYMIELAVYGVGE